MLRLKEGPNQLGPIFSTLHITFVQFFSLINYSLQDPITYAPDFFTTPLATPLATHISRLHSPLTFATHISRLTFATHISRLHSRLTFATHVCDSRLRLLSRLPHCATPPLTDGLCQHPSVISLALQP